MIKNYLLLLFLFTSILTSQAQQFNSSNISISRSDLETNVYEKDSTANALVLYEYGKSYVNNQSFKLTHEFKQKLKILNRKGFDQATILVYLYNSKNKKEKISNINATTHNLIDGRITRTKLKESEIYTEKYNENYTLVKFTLPNIQEGSVITYSYRVTLPFVYKYKSWEFQGDIPKLYSEYNTSIPGNYNYNIKLVGKNQLFKNEAEVKKSCLEVGLGGSADCTESIYVMKDIPAFIEEDYMTTRDNYLSRIEYELKVFQGFDGVIDNITKTWETTDKEIKANNSIGKQLNKNIKKEALLSQSTLNEKDALKKAELIYKNIQENYTWNGNYQIFKDVSVKDLIDKKSGSVSEINILLHNLLNASGIAVKPILLSTRNNGLPTTIYPVISDFNYLVVQATIDNKTYLLDATNKYLHFGQLPFKCLNQYGRLLDFKNGSEWIDINSSVVSNTRYKVDLVLDKDENINGKVDFTTAGYHALPEKESYFSNASQHENYLTENNENITISDYAAETQEINSLDFKEHFNINYTTEKIGDFLYVNPFLFTFFEENPFKLQERSYPIDFGYKSGYMYYYKIHIDDAFEIIETPKSINLNLPDNAGKLLCTTSVKNNEIVVLFKLSFNKKIYVKEYYPYMKELMNHVVNLQKNTTIVLKRK